jgi:hypothetical protein
MPRRSYWTRRRIVTLGLILVLCAAVVYVANPRSSAAYSLASPLVLFPGLVGAISSTKMISPSHRQVLSRRWRTVPP